MRRRPWLRHAELQWLDRLGRGFMLAAIIAGAATFLSQSHGGPVVLYALLIGMACGFLRDDPRLAPGLTFTAQTILRTGVALLGARITMTQVAAVGPGMMAMVTLAVIATVVFGVAMARWLGLSRAFGVLTAGATAICGASAAAALAAVLPRHEGSDRDTAFTIIGVTALSTTAMVLYPPLARMLGHDDIGIGIFLGATIHDVAQVVGAGYSVSPLAGDKATIVKLYRVALLLPMVMAVAWMMSSRAPTEGTAASAAATSEPVERPPAREKASGLLPPFLIVFALLVAAGSLGFIPAPVATTLSSISRWCIVLAIAAVGVKTSLQSFVEVGQPAIGMLIGEAVFLSGLVLVGMWLLR